LRDEPAAPVRLPRVAHGFAVERDWLPQQLAANQSLATQPEVSAARAPEIQDLPVTTVRATLETDTFALLLTGDCGWAGLDRELAAHLAAHLAAQGVSGRSYSNVCWDYVAP
jgi:type IV secretory pathway VirJ component